MGQAGEPYLLLLHYLSFETSFFKYSTRDIDPDCHSEGVPIMVINKITTYLPDCSWFDRLTMNGGKPLTLSLSKGNGAGNGTMLHSKR